jgi:hypothetical protein
MKQYLIMNIEQDITRYFTIDNIPLAKAKAKQLSWSNEKTIVCSLHDDRYEPTLQVDSCRLRVYDAYHVFENYLNAYKHALYNLPANFRHTLKFRQV